MDRKTWVTNFWCRVEQGGHDECWPWRGHRAGRRGMLKTPAGHKITAHNAAWMLKHQTRVPDGCRIEQECGNRFCCNPAHLSAVRLEGKAPTAVPGERNGNAKVTDRQVLEIRELYNISGRTQTQLAQEYGITQGQVSRIVRGCNR